VRAVGFCGYSGSGKTTLLEAVIAGLRAAGQRVGVAKHAHKHSFDIDIPGKDSWRHRQAGATEVVVGNGRRVARIREFEPAREVDAHDLLAELVSCDWALVEGFKQVDLPKVEVWRAALGRPPQYPLDPRVRAVITDDPAALPQAFGGPVFRLDQPQALVDHLLGSGDDYLYKYEHHG
jgi:molybdopterin-guanine dinucleotide biosynthesis protein B